MIRYAYMYICMHVYTDMISSLLDMISLISPLMSLNCPMQEQKHSVGLAQRHSACHDPDVMKLKSV